MDPVLDNLHVGILLVGHDGCIADANRAALEMLGTTRAVLLGQVCGSVQLPGVSGAALASPPAVDEPPQLVQVIHPGDGGVRWLECVRRLMVPTGQSTGQSTGQDVAWTCELVDVTAARAADLAQRQLERRLRTLVANLPGVVYRCRNDQAWSMELISDGVLALTGHPASAFTSGAVTFGSLIVEEDRDRVWREVQASVDASRPFELLYRLRGAGGRERWVWEQGTAVHDDDGAVTGLEGFLSDVTELRASEERYRSMFERNQAMKWIIDPSDGRILDVNEAAARFYGYSKEQLLRMRITDINLKPPDQVKADMGHAAREQRVHFEFRHRKANGEIVDVEVHSGPIELDGKRVLFSIVHDISEKKRLEEALRLAQKMEALGRLAGGVAHDFNNLMTVIVGASSLVLRDLPATSAHKERMVEIADAGKRAARLTRQLLAVGRRQLLAPQIIDVNEQLVRMQGMLRNALPAHVQLVTTPAGAPAWVEADPDQLEQVVLNLALNAGDAMPSSGTLTIRVLNAQVQRRDPANLDVPPGDYVVLEVADTGIGIEPVLMRHIFEPFYTTKPGHQGSGLGLAAVYGIVKQSGGSTSVESAPGRGSTFRVALPAAAPPRAVVNGDDGPVEVAQGERPSAPGHETVLVVDDDELVRRLTALMLEVQGYQVLVASGPEHALRIAVEHEGPIHLVLTDVMMPSLAGGPLVERLLQIRPNLRVLFVSGYVDEVAAPIPVLHGARASFLQKPVTPEELASKIRALLEG